AKLPEQASLSVFPARGGVRPSAVFAFTGPAAGIAEQLRSTPGVREVQTAGTRREEIDVRSDVDAAAIVAAITPRPLGESRHMEVIAAPQARRIRDLPILAGAEIQIGRA